MSQVSGSRATIRGEKEVNLRTGGEDTIDAALYVNWSDPAWEIITFALSKAQHEAQESQEIDAGVTSIDGTRALLVKPSGSHMGDFHGPFYKWRFECEGITYLVMNRQHRHETMPNVAVHVGSALLMEHGSKSIREKVYATIRAMGGIIAENKLSRVDPNVDIAGVSVSEFVKKFIDRHFLCRARKLDLQLGTVHMDGYNYTGFCVGRGDIRLRIYDKLLECKHQPLKLEILERTRWGTMPTAATRVEFQLRREALKEFGVSSWEDWEEKRASVCTYLCSEWFHFTDEAVDRNHTDRANTWSEWEAVQSAFSQWTGTADAAERNKKPRRVNAVALARQAVGCLTSLAAIHRERIDAREDFAGFVMDFLDTTGAIDTLTPAKVTQKRLELEASGYYQALDSHEQDAGEFYHDANTGRTFSVPDEVLQ